MPKVYAPFTDEQIVKLQDWQAGRITFTADIGDDAGIQIDVTPHPFTCCSQDCRRGFREDQGALIPTTDGWVCPCGKYTQDWAHDFMAE